MILHRNFQARYENTFEIKILIARAMRQLSNQQPAYKGRKSKSDEEKINIVHKDLPKAK